MSTTYSSLFSSGLLAPRTPRPMPSSPAIPSSPMDYHSIDRETTPTPSTPKEKPKLRLRKRRSSLTPAPMGSIKSPTRAARQSLVSPGRARSGSMASMSSNASESTSLVGRIRSGSLSNTLRPRRLVRRTPTAPPPTAPLPPVPTLANPPVTPELRRPLASRSHTLNNFLAPDFASKLALVMCTPPASPGDGMDVCAGRD